MCLLALLYRVAADAPVIVGANREEAYDRGGEPPQILQGSCRSVAGIDPLAGGTWLGVNEYRLLIAVTNRPKSVLPAKPRSRGLLVRQFLDLPSAEAAVACAAGELASGRYAGCNLLAADAQGASVLHAGDWLRVRPLPPGLHVLSAHDVNDEADRRIGHALWWLRQQNSASATEWIESLKSLCAQPGNGGPPICIHGDRGGTVSSSIIALRSTLARSSYWHAQGPPDRTPYRDYSPLFTALAQGTCPRG